MDLGIAGRIALIVGGSGLLGKATARQLLAEGATVVLAARDAGRLERAGAELGVPWLQVDTSDDASVAALVERVVAEHGGLDVVVCTAAPPATSIDPTRDREPRQVLAAIDTKAMGTLRLVEAVVPVLRERGWGRVVAVSGQNAYLSTSVTAASRNSVVSVVAQVTADRVAGSGVTVNVVHPGIVGDEPERDRGVGRAGDSTAAEVAATIAFLCSDQAGAISGEAVAVGHRVKGVIAL